MAGTGTPLDTPPVKRAHKDRLEPLVAEGVGLVHQEVGAACQVGRGQGRRACEVALSADLNKRNKLYIFLNKKYLKTLKE